METFPFTAYIFRPGRRGIKGGELVDLVRGTDAGDTDEDEEGACGKRREHDAPDGPPQEMTASLDALPGLLASLTSVAV
ncbi:MAG: hypothetical protein M3151_14960 [Actinomycetota bacterium]|nr:hypothetical protein [Actinomycetota bacterium]